MRVVEVRERSVPISRYSDPALASGDLTTSAVALVTDVVRDGRPVVGYGFSSMGRYAQGGLIRERFAPRLLAARDDDLVSPDGRNLDPFRAWTVMMAGEKRGGHGERCIAVGTLDMALWDAAAKIAGLPLHRYLAEHLGRQPAPAVRVYAGGGYPYPHDDVALLTDELRRMRELGYTHAKIKIGAGPLPRDLQRVEAALKIVPAAQLAVDAMNTYEAQAALAAAAALAPYGLWWFEDVCAPLDFETHAAVRAIYPGRVAAGEALFSSDEAKLLDRHGGLRRQQDRLLFDPVHCYGVSGFLEIVDVLEARGWQRSAFWPHGGHLFAAHVVSGLGLGGTEVNPFCFAPFGGLPDGAVISDGHVVPFEAPGIGWEHKADAWRLFSSLS
ncbi:MAG TPA: enolase C-terminal domain-like protein [Methylomirabilota bacterium]|nr:enolase C-terminal domain-like protein [Methylomirabilota bacterium]